jgi:hypothetical protein
MEERIKELIDEIGLERNTFQVIEGDYNNSNLYFPNFLTQASISKGAKDKELLDTLQRMMEEHAMDVSKAIKLFKRYRKNYE